MPNVSCGFIVWQTVFGFNIENAHKLFKVKNITEELTPEVSEKAKAIFKAMINDRRDSLFKEYGAEAEKVAYGKAIAQAKKEAAEPIEEINSIIYLQERKYTK